MTLASNSARAPVAPWVPAAVIGGLAVLAVACIWLIAVPVGPDVCALSMPAPRNCFGGHRVAAAAGPTVAIVGLAVVATSVAILVRRGRLAVTSIGAIVVLVAATASYLAAAWIPEWAFAW